MTTCACCGQHLSSPALHDIYADEALLACCHQAAELAQAEGSARIEIAHLVLALLRTQAAREAFARHHIGINDLAQAAAHQLGSTGRSRTDAAPEASAEFLDVLRRAEHATADAGRDTVTLRCLVETLLQRTTDLDGGAFLHQAQVHTRQTHVERKRVQTNGRDDAAIRERDRAGNRMPRPDRRQRRDADTRQAAQRPQPSLPAVAGNNSDPFQLRVNISSEADAGASHRVTHTKRQISDSGQRMRAPSPADTTIDKTTLTTLSDFDRRMREMQQQLSTVAAQMQRLTSDHDQSAQSRGAAARSGKTRGGRSTSSGGAASLRGPSDRDWERIARLLERLDKSAGSDNGRDRARRPGDRSVYHRQHQAKLRVRASRQDWRRKLTERFGRPEQDRQDAQWKTRDDQQHVKQTLSGTSLAFEADERDWEDEAETGGKRFYLEMDDEIMRAPSIGPRTSERLTPHGIERVRDLLAADAADLAERIQARHITTQRIEDWQMQARLVCTVPSLRGTHAQLLVGAGYTTPGDICAVSGDVLSADILKFASTRDGQRVLRSGPPPELEKIMKWAACAAEAELDRAA